MKAKLVLLALATTLVAGCAKQAEPAKDPVAEEATGPAKGSSGVGAVNKARSTAGEASSQTYKGDEEGK